MGTTFRVTIVADDLSAVEGALPGLIEDELAAVNHAANNYQGDTEITAFNRHASAAPMPISSPFVEVMSIAQEVSSLSGGAFDVTVTPLLEAWGFGPRGEPDAPPPSPEVLAALAERVGWQKLRLDPASGTLAKTHPGVVIDLSAIAPGYAADRIAAALERRQVLRYYIDVGGEIRTRGQNPKGQPWRVGIERPAADRGDAPALLEIVSPGDGALATSGDYRSYREIDGRRISHTIDPRTRAPIAHGLASVTVVHHDAAHADALATALNVLGPDEGMALAEREHLAVMMIVRDGDGFRTRSTPAFDALRVAGRSDNL